ncbi:MAG: PorP/SprF family type IX secretion system membrane protein [Bacteroidota bacterium]
MKRLLTYCFLLLTSCLCGQDIHYAQFNRSPLNLNPALTGLFNADLRFTANLRDQWQSVPVPYQSLAAGFDTRLLPQKLANHVLGIGGVFNYDQAGDSKLQWLNIGGTLAYAHRLSEPIWLSGGVLIEYRQRSFSSEALTFDDQFIGDVFDPSIQSNESITGQTIRFLNLGAGLNLHIQWGASNKLDVGSALFHIGKPDQSFFDDAPVPLFRKWTSHARLQLGLNEQLGLQIHALHQDQGPFREILYGAMGSYDLDDHRQRQRALLFGLSHRWDDAIIPEIGVRIQQLEVAFSYDINISDFSAATDGLGGPEIGLIYLITKVKPLGDFKACPIF